MTETFRAYITGMGVVSSVGNSVDDFWNQIVSGTPGIGPLSRIETADLGTTIGGEVADLDEPQLEASDRISWRKIDRSSQLAVVAATQAVRDARLPVDLGERSAVILGSGMSGMDTLQKQTEILLNRGPRRVSPFTIPALMPNASPANVGLQLGVKGPCYTISAACASSALAIIEAYHMLQRDDADFVICGGTEASLTRLGIASFGNMGAMNKRYNDQPERSVRPFDADRQGLVMSEGSGILILESAASVERRNAQPYAELTTFGSTTDSFSIVRPEPTGAGASRAIQQALDRVGWSPLEVASETYVNAHGTGTKANDVAETIALKRVFGEAASRLQISSTKSMTGHMIGAAAAIESIVCIKALQTGLLPPTINLDTPDPECDLDYIPNTSRTSDVRFALNNSFGFGGHNVCLGFNRVVAW